MQWQVTKEINIEKYTVERSVDGRTFSSIGNVTATSPNENVHQYRFTDSKPLAGNNFYRLKIADKDGKISYSAIVKIYFGSNWQVTISPNPAKNVLYVQSSQAGIITINLYDAAGKKVKQFTASSFASGEVKQINIAGLLKGLYSVETQSGTDRQVSKIIVE